jgi:hypothetical protein
MSNMKNIYTDAQETAAEEMRCSCEGCEKRNQKLVRIVLTMNDGGYGDATPTVLFLLEELRVAELALYSTEARRQDLEDTLSTLGDEAGRILTKMGLGDLVKALEG